MSSLSAGERIGCNCIIFPPHPARPDRDVFKGNEGASEGFVQAPSSLLAGTSEEESEPAGPGCLCGSDIGSPHYCVSCLEFRVLRLLESEVKSLLLLENLPSSSIKSETGLDVF